MKYIRTEKNKYNIDIIIDICDNLQFIETSGLDWIAINDEMTPNLGDYFYEGKIITFESDDYKIIEDIIFDAEEPNRIEREKNLPPIVEEEIIEESITESESDSYSREPNVEPILTEEIIQNILELPKPQIDDFSDIESTIENYESWTQNLNNINATISACDSGNYTVEGNEVTFDPPIEYPDGRIEKKLILPLSLTVEEQIQHLKKQRDQMIALLDRMKKDLQITD